MTVNSRIQSNQTNYLIPELRRDCLTAAKVGFGMIVRELDHPSWMTCR
jgi:hypothetical protein